MLRCRVCKARFSERKGTPYFDSRLPRRRRSQSVMDHIAEGCGVRQTGQLCMVDRGTVGRLSRIAGDHARDLHDELVAFSPEHSVRLKFDEKWAFVAIRQGFSHREADAKSLLDEASSPRDGGSGGVQSAIVGTVRPVDGNGPVVYLRNRSQCAASEKPRPLWLGDAAQCTAIGVQLICPSGLRHAETRVLAEEPRPATAAVGTSRLSRVVIGHLVEGLIGQFRQLAQRFREARDLGWLRGATGVARIKSTQARLDSSRFEGCQSP